MHRHACVLALWVFGAAVAWGCKATDEFLGSKEIEKYRKEGLAAGQGLNVDKALDKAKRAAEQAAGVAAGAAANLAAHEESPSDRGSLYQLLWRRARCGVDAACMRETARALRDRSPGVGRELIELIRRDVPYDIRVEAIRALGWLRVTSATKPLLEVLQEDQPAAFKREVLWALGQIRDPGAVSTLVAFYEETPDTRLRSAVLNALGNIDSKEAVAFLARVVGQAKGALRQVAVAALGRSSRPESVEVLAKALRDPDPVVRTEAFNALVIMDNAEARRILAAIREGRYGEALARRLREQAQH